MTNAFDDAKVSLAAIPGLVEALRRVHAEDPGFSGAPAPAAEGLSLYRRLREGLARAEARARNEAAARPPPALRQETLYLNCRRAGRTAGRFRCENALGREVEMRIVTRPFSIGREALTSPPKLLVSPAQLKLPADGSVVIAVQADLAPCPEISGHGLQTSLDLILDEALAIKLWIEIDIYELD
jgi:hypothetical protein